MTETKHRSRAHVRSLLWTGCLLAIAACVFALGNLYHVQGEYQRCVANYLAADSAAKNVRTDASANTIQALVLQSLTLSKALDPTKQPPDEKTVEAALEAIAAVPAVSEKYNASIDDFPYPKYTCGGNE